MNEGAAACCEGAGLMAQHAGAYSHHNTTEACDSVLQILSRATVCTIAHAKAFA